MAITFTPCFYAIFCAKLVDYNKEWANRVRHLYLLLLAGPTAAPAAPCHHIRAPFLP